MKKKHVKELLARSVLGTEARLHAGVPIDEQIKPPLCTSSECSGAKRPARGDELVEVVMREGCLDLPCSGGGCCQGESRVVLVSGVAHPTASQPPSHPVTTVVATSFIDWLAGWLALPPCLACQRNMWVSRVRRQTGLRFHVRTGILSLLLLSSRRPPKPPRSSYGKDADLPFTQLSLGLESRALPLSSCSPQLGPRKSHFF